MDNVQRARTTVLVLRPLPGWISLESIVVLSLGSSSQRVRGAESAKNSCRHSRAGGGGEENPPGQMGVFPLPSHHSQFLIRS